MPVKPEEWKFWELEVLALLYQNRFAIDPSRCGLSYTQLAHRRLRPLGTRMGVRKVVAEVLEKGIRHGLVIDLHLPEGSARKWVRFDLPKLAVVLLPYLEHLDGLLGEGERNLEFQSYQKDDLAKRVKKLKRKLAQARQECQTAWGDNNQLALDLFYAKEDLQSAPKQELPWYAQNARN